MSFISRITRDALIFFNVYCVLNVTVKQFESFSYFCITCQNVATLTSIILLLLDPFRSVESGDTVFQNNLLLVILPKV